MFKKGNFGKKIKSNFGHFFCLLLSSSSFLQKKIIITIFLEWALAIFWLPKHVFCLSYCITYWTMSMDNVGLTICLLGTSKSMVTLTFWPWCKPKWSQDVFTNQLQILQGLGRLHGPWYKQPLKVRCWLGLSNEHGEPTPSYLVSSNTWLNFKTLG